MPHVSTDWDSLRAGMSALAGDELEAALRRVLRRQLKQLGNNDLSLVPESVRSQAVGIWRSRYMQGASKAARQRMKYAQLRSKPTYQEIVRELFARRWESVPRNTLPGANEVDDLPFSVVCELLRKLHTKGSEESLRAYARRACRAVYKNKIFAEDVREKIAQRVLDVLRDRDLAEFARTHGVQFRRQATRGDFGLDDLTEESQVTARVHAMRLIERVILGLYHRRSVFETAQTLLSSNLAADPDVAGINTVLKALFKTGSPLKGTLASLSSGDAHRIEESLLGPDFEQEAASALLQNYRYGQQFSRSRELRLRVRQSVPTTPMEAYPLARTMRRHFVLHVGPTNSGKTHDALQALMEAPSGVYLGPLRLLAYEQFELMNVEGCPCSLLTGEEAAEVAGARHTSSTVEMANFLTPVDVAVIDEAQMICDPDRGCNWTAAILGIPAREVHVCCAPHAERVLRDLVDLCDDTLEVSRHDRLVPLVSGRRNFRMPADLCRGDALIVFSRRSVHAVASQVAAAGMRASLIYGALPHDVRHEEARRFNEGETDVVVATDAIGMGMNLPIRRIVFMEQEKYDGHARRQLRPEEVQQIAGRAGRFGQYGRGSFTSARLSRTIRELYGKSVRAIDTIPVGIPDDIALVQGAKLSDCIRQWLGIEQAAPFVRINVARDLALIAEVEAALPPERLEDIRTKQMVLALATMAFDERDRVLRGAWRHMVRAQIEETELDLAVPDGPAPGDSLADLEARYRYCDLLYGYARTFDRRQDVDALVKRRNQISHAIMDLLRQSAMKPA